MLRILSTWGLLAVGLVSVPALAVDTRQNDGAFPVDTMDDVLLDETPVSLSLEFGPGVFVPSLPRYTYPGPPFLEGPAATVNLSAGRWVNRHLCLTGELSISTAFGFRLGADLTVGANLFWNVAILFDGSEAGMSRLELGPDLSFAAGAEVVEGSGGHALLQAGGGLVGRYRVSPHLALGARARTWVPIVGSGSWPLNLLLSIEWLI